MTELIERGERIRYAAKRVGGNDSLAEKAGVSKRTLSNYIAGVNDIGTSEMGRIADASGLPLEWLVYGRGNVEGFASKTQGAYEGMPSFHKETKVITPDIVQQTVAALYKHLEDKKLTMDAESMGEVAAILTEWAAEAGGFNQALIERIMRLKSR